MKNILIKGGESTGAVKLIYCLLLVGIIVPFASIVGVVIAYIYRSDAADWLQQHYRFQIRTFWIGVLVGIISFVLTFFFIGYLLYLCLLVWIIIRCVKGLKVLSKGEPPEKPGTWLF